MASKTVGMVLIAAATAGCATTGSSNPWRPARLAPDSNIYTGAALGSSSYDQSQQDTDALTRSTFAQLGAPVTALTSTQDDSDFGFGAVLGYRFAPFFGVELAYMDLGKLKYNANVNLGVIGPGTADIEVGVDGVGISGLAFLPLTETWEVYFRGGLLFSNTETRGNFAALGQNVPGEVSSNSEDLFAGLGGSYRFGDQYTFRLEYQRFMDVGSDTGEGDIDFVGLQVMYSIF